ncbi:hypothetical protein [Pontibacter sp. G13]|uniref:hypothetical protein n=1 Tax=Pontibacter sp. G13 TaxID=3074898 RepID=UPI00288BEFF4|nr:hypothetical protein [Pontibacter sp. G13]WNJ21565.1 hypothetical protein RJD25_28725 [Pontibacter sp. G13]
MDPMFLPGFHSGEPSFPSIIILWKHPQYRIPHKRIGSSQDIIESEVHGTVFQASQDGIELVAGYTEIGIPRDIQINRLGEMSGQVGLLMVCVEFRHWEANDPIEDCHLESLATMPSPQPLFPSLDFPGLGCAPMFSWTPVVPPSPEIAVNYDLRVVELLPHQDHGTAMGGNIPVLHLSNLSAPMVPFPSNMEDLVSGRSYVWQVLAYDETGLFLSQSEIAEFIPNCRTEGLATGELKPPYMPFADLERGAFTGMFPAYGEINFSVDMKRPGRLPSVSIEDHGGNILKVPQGQVLARNVRSFTLYTSNIQGLEIGEAYTLHVIGFGGKKYQLPFRFQGKASR